MIICLKVDEKIDTTLTKTENGWKTASMTRAKANKICLSANLKRKVAVLWKGLCWNRLFLDWDQ